jgi:ABC-type Zn uptake system ZnuABC Zn-binding protein ZnuA
MKKTASASALLLVIVVAACGSGDDGSEATVSATTGIAADITEQIAGGDIEVEQVIPDSASPHDFSLSAQDRADLEDSDLIVSNGAGLETGIPLDEIDTPRFAFADHAGELLAFGEGEEHPDHGDSHAEEAAEEEADRDHAGEDPHLWMDPSRVAAIAPALGEALAEVDPEHADGYRARADRYARRIRALDAEISRTLNRVPPADRRLVTSHDALAYFADRYGFEVVATAFPASGPEAEASAAAIQEVEDAITASGVAAVFAEETDDPQALEQIADRTGVEVVGGLLVEAPGDSGSYAEMMRLNSELIAAALTGSGDEARP